MAERSAKTQVPGIDDTGRSLAQPPGLYPELDRYRDFQQQPEYSFKRPEIDVHYQLTTHEPPPTPLSQLFSGGSSQISAVSGSPSTKLSDSPGPGPYSRDTTPTSISSQSPVFVAPSRVGITHRNGRQHSVLATRPPVSRRRAGSFPDEASIDPHGLASVRESLTSSSSNSTVKEGDRATRKEKAKARHLSPPPPSPPPRKSSQKFAKSKERNEILRLTKHKIPESGDIAIKKKPHSPTYSDASSPIEMGPPARPSRHNTPDMKSQLCRPIPVIQSNLVSTMRTPEGRGSGASGTTSLPGTTMPIAQNGRHISSSTVSPGHEGLSKSLKSRPSFDKLKGQVTEPGLSPQTTQSRFRSTSRSRFPFFGRKKATFDIPKKEDRPNKKEGSRKGPAAGTGHEGYGRVGAIRRRSGSGSVLPHGVTDPVSSYDSLASSDSFLTDRMNPVIISGGEVVQNSNASAELSRSETNHSLPGRRSIDSKMSSEGSFTSYNESRTELRPSALPRLRTSSPHQPNGGTWSDELGMESTLAFRRSMQRLQLSPDDPLRLPQLLQTCAHVSPSPLTSLDTTLLSDDSQLELTQGLSQESARVNPVPKKLKRETRAPRIWKLFSRTQSQSSTKKTQSNENIEATVRTVGERPIAFYTMLDNVEPDESGHLDSQEELRQAEVHKRTPIMESHDYQESVAQSSRRLVADFPIQKYWQTSSDSHSITTIASSGGEKTSSQTGTHQMKNNLRPSRLQRVGRIPQVIKLGTENASPQSFSRPFRASSHHPTWSRAEIHDSELIAVGSTPPNPPKPLPEPSGKWEASESGTRFSPHSISGSDISAELGEADREFLSLSPRKNSSGTINTSSSSSGAASPFFTTATAVIPKPEDPPAEDEIWDEYDDLLSDDGIKRSRSATSSKGAPFHLETYQRKLANGIELDSPTVAVDSRKTSTYSEAPTQSPCYRAGMTARIRCAFQPKTIPQSVGTQGHGISEAQLDKPADAEGTAALKRNSCSSCQTTFSDFSSCSSNDGSPLAQVNLRVGSMTVSKWLTFGHVLFSDVRHELVHVKTSSKQHSILVIDGLGNDDWSFYAAETYPGASFFNLSPRAPLPVELEASSAGYPLSPANHHQVQYTSHLEKFPFASQSFHAVVYRFPIAASEVHYRNVLNEALRVLRPDGYIELSILDSDLNNMGNRGRRAIRQLKERIHQSAPDTTFASAADLTVRLLGKAGFSHIKAARVGIPVASSITRPGSHKSESKRDPDQRKKGHLSLAETMRDSSPLADANITKIVTRVGRWWYTRCYENAFSLGSEGSIWDDKMLLSECEKLGTSLKLMVCCARAPERRVNF
ncbi:uncharacterized protein MAM_01334 [Metarhizium album ARSEF 1941]|uniref:Methyltransferase type 11 n=1 Tax=Metarhizium album (strain ARSEF 1941) TaxID=1081103 RepID=A0A0B2X5G8_METAS|nr:uncharacterized protein MAM_01334 [Metarhizium album ARSEF 1941]KHO00556.1 hypothetical protein MAM_01334 [Metarhizium album ARSEF 1941]